MDTSSLIILQVPVLVIAVLAFLYYRKIRNDMQTSDKCGIRPQSEPNGSVPAKEFAVNHSQNSGASHKPLRGHHRNQGGGNSNLGGVSKRQDKNAVHPFTAATFKGHTAQVLDIGFSSNGKYLASCAEDGARISPTHNRGHRNSATSDLANSDDVGSSSNEESPSVHSKYNDKVQKCNKNSHRNRQRKNQQNRSKNRSPMEIEDKENHQPNRRCTTASWRKHMGKSSSSLSSTSSSASSSASNSPKQQRFIPPTPFIPSSITDIITRAVTPPLRQHTKLNVSETMLVGFLRHYVINPEELKTYGYPIEIETDPTRAYIFKSAPGFYHGMSTQINNYNFGNDRNNRDIPYNCSQNIYKPVYEQADETWEDNTSENIAGLSSDSGQCSGSSLDSDSSDMGEEEVLSGSNNELNNCDVVLEVHDQLSEVHVNIDPRKIQANSMANERSNKKECVRCRRGFFITVSGSYLTQENCVFHWGKVDGQYECGKYSYKYTCCKSDQYSKGCTTNRLHVWNGISVGLNGPFDGFVKTRNKSKDKCNYNLDKNNPGVYALDCEMCFTGLGLECTKVTVVGSDGHIVYEHMVRPDAEIIDYNTRFSGITERDLSHKNNNVKTLKEVQTDLLHFISADTILIGHALDNDLRALKIIHKTVIDTSILFKHNSGFPFRRSLKSLTKTHLKRDIQVSDLGHSSFEDSRAALELILWRVRKDFRTILEH